MVQLPPLLIGRFRAMRKSLQKTEKGKQNLEATYTDKLHMYLSATTTSRPADSCCSLLCSKFCWKEIRRRPSDTFTKGSKWQRRLIWFKYLVKLRELLVSDEGLFTGKLSSTQQTGQFQPVCQSPFPFISFSPLFFAISFSTVGRDQTLLQRWGALGN